MNLKNLDSAFDSFRLDSHSHRDEVKIQSDQKSMVHLSDKKPPLPNHEISIITPILQKAQKRFLDSNITPSLTPLLSGN